ncbi:DUF3575 domain-containing protein [Hymenobacter fodinae]|uniref:DUF3575 domain-containing protein n=1 Tax=Hymenobacter fodinae TaxID=2510796 RepID=A0A4Z0P7H7_9BACT|nr:DUF3575 domain-containing protein [Hymenobacter fodinae]TGE08303.1 DUF3575 domain-containing protein [Hymenobacter fodinae]
MLAVFIRYSRLCYRQYFLLLLSLLCMTPVARGQTVTVKLSANPLLQVEERIPLSVALGAEVGPTPHSSLQMVGSYRHFSAPDAHPDQGLKAYLDYRYYFRPEQPATGLFASPFVGLGQLHLGAGDDPQFSLPRRRRTEREAGVVVGYQALYSWLTAELFAGPAYRWQTTSGDSGSMAYTTSTQFVWLRAGFTVGVRLKKQ